MDSPPLLRKRRTRMEHRKGESAVVVIPMIVDLFPGNLRTRPAARLIQRRILKILYRLGDTPCGVTIE